MAIAITYKWNKGSCSSCAAEHSAVLHAAALEKPATRRSVYHLTIFARGESDASHKNSADSKSAVEQSPTDPNLVLVACGESI